MAQVLGSSLDFVGGGRGLETRNALKTFCYFPAKNRRFTHIENLMSSSFLGSSH